MPREPICLRCGVAIDGMPPYDAGSRTHCDPCYDVIDPPSPRPTPTTSIRLPSVPKPVSLALSDDEREAILRAAGDASVSTWARHVIDAAAGADGPEYAASAARMPLRAWVRVVLLEAAGVTDLRGQLARASRSVKRRG